MHLLVLSHGASLWCHAATHFSPTSYEEIQSRTTHLMITMQVNCMGQEQTW